MLRDIQKQRIAAFLNKDIPWKVLVLDNRTHEIISPLLKINDLREHGVTTHLLINNPRSPITDTPAVYFVGASPSNLARITSDITQGLYSEYFLNFTNSVDRKNLEKLAHELSQKRLALKVRSVCDQFLDFICLQEDLFTFEIHDSLLRIGTEGLVKEVVDGLYGVFFALGGIPFMVSKNDTVCDKVMNQLEQRLKHSPMLKGNIAGLKTALSNSQTQRPLLVILERPFDLSTPAQHVWTYAALIHDLLPFKLNKVTLKDKSYSLDPSDPFWAANQNEYFPVVAERIEKELLDYKKEMALRSLDERADKRLIQEALDQAPELARRNESLQCHMALCLELVNQIKERSIDDFYRAEKGQCKRKELVDICEKGAVEDVKRMAVSLVGKEDENVLVAMLEKKGVGPSLLNSVKKQESVAVPSSFLSSAVVSNILGSVKKLLPASEETPLSRFIIQVHEALKSQHWDESKFMVKNPLKGQLYEKEVSCVVIFCLGGLTFTELKSCRGLENRMRVPVICGGSELLSGGGLIDQLERIKSTK